MDKSKSKMKFNLDGTYNGKFEIITELCKSLGLPRNIVEKIIDALLLKLKDDILSQRVIHLPGVGSITYRKHNRHTTSGLTQIDYGRTEIMYPRFKISSDTLRRYRKKYTKKVGD